MFTTGSKLLLGATTLSLVGAIVFAASTGGPTGVMGTVGLLSLTCVFAFLAGINLFNRDGNVPAMQEGVEYTSPAAQPPVGSSMWPLVAAVGVAGVAIGAVSTPVVFKVSVIVLIAAIVEWMVQGWSERASADSSYNATLRKRIMNPLEFPLLGAIGLAAVVYSFSRVMLSIDKDAGRWVFGLIGGLVLLAGFVFGSRRNRSKGTVAGVCAVAAVALLGVGVASAVQGQRTIDEHPTTADDTALCLEGGEDAEIDEKAGQDVSLKSNVIANVYLQSNGVVIAYVTGYPDPVSDLTVPRSLAVGIRFHNDFDSPERLTGHLGTFGDSPENVICTTAVNPGKETYLNFKIPKTNAASSTPLVLAIPGLEGQEIRIQVP